MACDPRRALGSFGEDIAERHLASAGYRIVDRNFRTRFGELDIVAIGRGAIVFCEVKTRLARSKWPMEPLAAVGADKRRRLRRMAAQWLAARSQQVCWGSDELRFDAVGVVVDSSGGLVALDHVENAF